MLEKFVKQPLILPGSKIIYLYQNRVNRSAIVDSNKHIHTCNDCIQKNTRQCEKNLVARNF